MGATPQPDEHRWTIELAGIRTKHLIYNDTRLWDVVGEYWFSRLDGPAWDALVADIEAARRLPETEADYAAAKRYNAAAAKEVAHLQAERDALAAKLDQAVFGSPAEMSYAGRLIPINSTGMREVVDEATRLRAARDALAATLATAREFAERFGGYPATGPWRQLIALLSDTPDTQERT